MRWIGTTLLCLLVILFAGMTWSHCVMFHDNETLYVATIERNPGSWMAHNNLGLAWSKIPGRLDDAVAQYQDALRLKPDIPETHSNLGKAFALMPGRQDDAIAEFREALRLDPSYSAANFYLANALVARGQIPEAIAHFEAALQSDPNMAEASNNLGMIPVPHRPNTGRAQAASTRRSASSRILSRRISPVERLSCRWGAAPKAVSEFVRVSPTAAGFSSCSPDARKWLRFSAVRPRANRLPALGLDFSQAVARVHDASAEPWS